MQRLWREDSGSRNQDAKEYATTLDAAAGGELFQVRAGKGATSQCPTWLTTGLTEVQALMGPKRSRLPHRPNSPPLLAQF